MLIGSDVDAHSDSDDYHNQTMMVMMLLNIAMNKTAVAAALGSTERIDGIRRQVSRLSDRAPSLLVSSSDCYLDFLLNMNGLVKKEVNG